LFATTRAFLDDLNLSSLEELPRLDDLGSLVETATVAAAEPAAAYEPEPLMIEEPRREAA